MVDNQAEGRLSKLFTEHGIEFERQRPLLSRSTGRQRYPDFYLPNVDLYVEVKGVFTFDSIRKLDELARHNRNYYLYSGSDYDWQAYASDWPEAALSRAAAGRLDSYRRRISSHWQRRSRETMAYRYKTHDLKAGVALQNKELLRVAQDVEMAKHASAVSLVRLRRYANMMVDEFLMVGLLSEERWRRS